MLISFVSRFGQIKIKTISKAWFRLNTAIKKTVDQRQGQLVSQSILQSNMVVISNFTIVAWKTHEFHIIVTWKQTKQCSGWAFVIISRLLVIRRKKITLNNTSPNV